MESASQRRPWESTVTKVMLVGALVVGVLSIIRVVRLAATGWPPVHPWSTLVPIAGTCLIFSLAFFSGTTGKWQRVWTLSTGTFAIAIVWLVMMSQMARQPSQFPAPSAMPVSARPEVSDP